MSSSAVMHGQMADYMPLSQGYVCENMKKELYGSKLTAESDLNAKETHSCYEASLYEGLQFGKEKGIPLASKTEISEEWSCYYSRKISS
ncbi:unnamed protein product [Microthlaspi erraticum]|uniref:Uncharacterized protein n=1 Tax=Microthlaspi erraticum TaxID=1685480 RepID=A0A6D2JPV1_9BRAS|nr:unnamed protein product [Microthlaspi erraticum]